MEKRNGWPLFVERFVQALPWLIGLWLLAERALSDGVVEPGDGVQHYMIARYAQVHPRLFLDHWGKPLFTLLASPFAQLGHQGVAFFNVLCAIAMAFAGSHALRKAGLLARALFVMVVMVSPLYVPMVLGGMTEILFGTLTVCAVALLHEEKPKAAALIASFTPFARPEYVAFLPLVVCWLAWKRDWKAVILCSTGLVVYGIIGWGVLGDPFWFWTNNPYNAEGAYGSGDGWQFFTRADEIFGRPLLVLGIASLILWAVVYWKDREQRPSHRLLLFVCAVPTLLVMAIHAWAWQHGTHGSAGLLRVIVTVIPLAGLFTFFTLGRGAVLMFNARQQAAGVLGPVVFAGVTWWSLSDLLLQYQLPVHPSMEQVALDKAGDLIKARLPKERMLWSSHPYIPFRAGIDTFDPQRFGMFYGYNADVVKNSYKTGDLLCWDALLGSSVEHCPLDEMLADTNLIVRSVMEPFERQHVLGGYVREMIVYERGTALRTHTTDTLVDGTRVNLGVRMRMDTVPGQRTWQIKDEEFPFDINALPWPAGANTLFDLFRISIDLELPDTAHDRVVFVYNQVLNDRHLRYDQEELHNGPNAFWIRVPFGEQLGEQKMYLWNITKHSFTIRSFRLTREHWMQREPVTGS